MKSNFEKDPRRQPEKTVLMFKRRLLRSSASCSDSSIDALTEVKRPDQLHDDRSIQRFLAAVLDAFTAEEVTVLKLASAISVACLTAF